MEEAKKTLMKCKGRWLFWGEPDPCPPSDEEFQHAISMGLMFPYRKTVGHSECISRAKELREIITAEDVANAFLYSLSTRRLEYRSALGSYWYVKAMPDHECDGRSPGCGICKWDTFNDLPCKYEYQNEYNIWNRERYKYGGVRHTRLQYAVFDLEEFVKLPKVTYTEEDERLLLRILDCVSALEPRNKARPLQKLITSRRILKSNKDEIDILLNILGICGVLENDEHHCYAEGFMDCTNRNPPEHTNDYAHPLNWWRAMDGIHWDRVQIVFPGLNVQR